MKKYLTKKKFQNNPLRMPGRIGDFGFCFQVNCWRFRKSGRGETGRGGEDEEKVV